MTIGAGLVMAAICEIAGALISGTDVVRTIATGIVRADQLQDPLQLSLVMMAALIAAAAWINIATWINAPVSTTHSIVGGVLGAGVAAAGTGAVNWAVLGGITISWVLSPLLGAMIAIAMLSFIKSFIIYTPDKIAAACRWCAGSVALMFGSFTTYLLIVLPNEIVFLPMSAMLAIGFGSGLLVWLASRPSLHGAAKGLENRNQSLRVLFRIPLIFSAALLSFAHGANDVSNAIGPLAAIVSALKQSPPIDNVTRAPLGIDDWWFWYRSWSAAVRASLVNLVGKEITKLNPMRPIASPCRRRHGYPGIQHRRAGQLNAYCRGLGFRRRSVSRMYIRKSAQRQAYQSVTAQEQGMVEVESIKAARDNNQAEERRRRLVRRSHLLSILAAWMITVPLSAALAGGVVMLMLRFLT